MTNPLKSSSMQPVRNHTREAGWELWAIGSTRHTASFQPFVRPSLLPFFPGHLSVKRTNWNIFRLSESCQKTDSQMIRYFPQPTRKENSESLLIACQLSVLLLTAPCRNRIFSPYIYSCLVITEFSPLIAPPAVILEPTSFATSLLTQLCRRTHQIHTRATCIFTRSPSYFSHEIGGV